MTQIPAGWYPDPAQTHHGRQRYWDGSQWTGHVHDPEPPAPPSYPQPYGQGYSQTYGQPSGQGYGQGYGQPYSHGYGQPAYQPYPPTGYAPAPQPKTTPDGQQLAGWGARAGAYLIDGVIQLVLNLVVWIPLVLVNMDRVREFGDRLDAWSQQSEPDPFPLSTYSPLVPLVVELGLASLLISAIYTIGFWRWKQATPGKLALGLRIRRRESPDLPWSAILLRYGFYLVVGVVGLVPFVGYATGFVQLLDFLWPLWDDKRQALHDKVAGTNVVVSPRKVEEPSTEELTASGLPRRW